MRFAVIIDDPEILEVLKEEAKKQNRRTCNFITTMAIEFARLKIEEKKSKEK